MNGKVHASEREGLILSIRNPLDAARMVLVIAGNDALSTVKAQKADLPADEYVILRDGEANERLHPESENTGGKSQVENCTVPNEKRWYARMDSNHRPPPCQGPLQW